MPAVLRIEILPTDHGRPDRCNAGSSGLWRSLVARFVWDEDVAGSNPVSPTSDCCRSDHRGAADTMDRCLGLVVEACEVPFSPMMWSAAQ